MADEPKAHFNGLIVGIVVLLAISLGYLTMDEMHWRGIQGDMDDRVYTAHTEMYTFGRHKRQAADVLASHAGIRNKASEDAWKETVQTDTVQAYKYYIRRFPGGAYVAQARGAQISLRKAGERLVTSKEPPNTPPASSENSER